MQDYLFKEHKKDLERLNLIKIDAEGYDKEILKTIPKILEDYKPNLMIECYKKLNKEERYDLYDTIRDFGYNLFYLENFEQFDTLKKIERINMTNKKHFEMLATHKSKDIGV